MNLKVGQDVRIEGSGTVHDGSVGIIQYLQPSDKYPVFVKFDKGGNGFTYDEIKRV